MARRGRDNDHMKSGQLRQRGQYRIQHVRMIYWLHKWAMRRWLT